MVTCEVCVEGFPGALAAEKGGAHRFELCAGLVEGGTTPSMGTVSKVFEDVSIPGVVLIRPRGGDFLYTPAEMDVLLRDVESVREAGAFGIATGVLTEGADVDVGFMARVMDAAGAMNVTFHRAFDMTRDPREALEALVGLGVDRILTSGQERSVPEGLALIRELVELAGDRISIMPGGGVTEENLGIILQHTGVNEIHFTAFSSGESPMTHRNTRPLMGSDRVPGEYERLETDAERIRTFLASAESYA